MMGKVSIENRMVSVILTLSLGSPLDATPTLNRYTHMRQSRLVQAQALIWMAEERMDLHLNEGKLEPLDYREKTRHCSNDNATRVLQL